MSLFVNIISPIIVGVLLLSVIVWIMYISYWITKKIYPTLRLLIKYKILKRKFLEKDLEWVINAIDNGMTKDSVKILLLKDGSTLDRVDDILYIYDTVSNEHIKQLKGGEVNQWRVTK